MTAAVAKRHLNKRGGAALPVSLVPSRAAANPRRGIREGPFWAARCGPRVRIVLQRRTDEANGSSIPSRAFHLVS